MFKLKRAEMFYGDEVYTMHHFGDNKYNTIDKVPTKEEIAWALKQQNPSLSVEEYISRLNIVHKQGVPEFALPEYIVAYGKGFHIIWYKEDENEID